MERLEEKIEEKLEEKQEEKVQESESVWTPISLLPVWACDLYLPHSHIPWGVQGGEKVLSVSV